MASRATLTFLIARKRIEGGPKKSRQENDVFKGEENMTYSSISLFKCEKEIEFSIRSVLSIQSILHVYGS